MINSPKTCRLPLYAAYLGLWLLTFACARNAADEGRVVAVKDGDTIELMQQGKAITVRLYGIDTPEKRQPFGSRARQATSDLAFGRTVRLEPVNTDRYGRTVGKIYLPDGRSLNEELVRQGYAWHYTAYSKDPRLAELEVSARQQRLGIWADAQPQAPWEFRQQRRAGHPAVVTPADRAAFGSLQTVWVCSSKTSKTFHADMNCTALKRCGKEIIRQTPDQAAQQGKVVPCKVCLKAGRS